MLVLFLIACTDQRTDAVRFGLSTAPVTLDPRHATDAVSQRINRLIYKRLVDFDENYNMIPALAQWQQLAPNHYRFRLGMNGRKFHDGGDLTAMDVKATYDSILDPAVASPHRATLTNISEIVVVDENTMDFRLQDTDLLFPGRLVIGIVPARLISSGHPLHVSPVGSGELKFIDWPHEDQLRLQRIVDGKVIEFVTVKDSTVRVLKLLNGEIDIIQNDLPFELLQWLEGKPEIAVETGQGSVFTYLGFNMQDPALMQLNIRRAIAYALDRASIIKFVLGNSARKAGSLLPPDHWAGHPGLHGYEYDPDQAQQLLRQAGYHQNHPLKISYKTSNNPLRVRLATIIQYQLRQVGIDIKVQSYDWGTFYGDIKSGRFQMYGLSWVGLNMPDIFHYVFHSASLPPAGGNRGRYQDPAVDSMLEQTEYMPGLSEQAAGYRKLQEYLHGQLPYVPLWYEDNILARREVISGYELSADGNYDGLLMVTKTGE